MLHLLFEDMLSFLLQPLLLQLTLPFFLVQLLHLLLIADQLVDAVYADILHLLRRALLLSQVGLWSGGLISQFSGWPHRLSRSHYNLWAVLGWLCFSDSTVDGLLSEFAITTSCAIASGS